MYDPKGIISTQIGYLILDNLDKWIEKNEVLEKHRTQYTIKIIQSKESAAPIFKQSYVMFCGGGLECK